MENGYQRNQRIVGWQKYGEPIDTPEGIHAEDYFDADGRYLGPDAEGVEPIFAGAVSRAE